MKNKFMASLKSLFNRGVKVKPDLRHPGHKRFGAFNPDGPRGAGAWWLRRVFSQDLKMVSTRDGKPV